MRPISSDEIVTVDAWEVLDSRGNPTVACSVTLVDGSTGTVSVPSGASTGRHEAHELRDRATRYQGKGVLIAAQNARGALAAAVIGRSAGEQRSIDEALRAADGSPTLSNLGANAVLAVSLAVAHASAAHCSQPLWQTLGSEPMIPLPMVNIISGGAHAGGLIDIQDLLVVPVGATSFAEAIEWCAEVRYATGRVADELGIASSLVADEGGIAGRLGSNRAGLTLLASGVERSGLALGSQIGFAIDVAATQFVDEHGRYVLASEDRVLDAGEWIDEVAAWCGDFPIISVEDVVAEDDWTGWEYATEQLSHIQLLGDDLFVTDLARLQRGINAQVANAVLVKVNQNGTLTGGCDVIEHARRNQYATVVSARSGETEDYWLADLAVGTRAGQIKVGSTTRSERTSKWNRLLHIERTVGADAYVGGSAIIPNQQDQSSKDRGNG